MLHGGGVPLPEVRALGSLPHFQKLEDGHSHLGLRLEPAAIEQLAIQRRKEALSHGVVPELLLERGADIHAKTDSGFMPLHTAADEGRKEIVVLLLARGAEVNARNKDGETPLTLAEKRNDPIVKK